MDLVKNVCFPNQKEFQLCVCSEVVFFNAEFIPDHKYHKLKRCPRCRARRKNKRTGKPTGSTVYYNTLQDLLQLQFATEERALGMRLRKPRPLGPNEPMTDVTDSPGYRECVLEDRDFCRERRNQVVVTSSDGWPVNGLTARHNAWSCSSAVLNRDPVERGKAHNLLHHFTTAGGKSPKSFTGIGKLLVDDLLRAWHVGVRIFDGATREWFLCRVKLLFLLADYPGNTAR